MDTSMFLWRLYRDAWLLMVSPKAWPVICNKECPTRIQGASKLLGKTMKKSVVNRLCHVENSFVTDVENEIPCFRSNYSIANRFIGDKYPHDDEGGGGVNDKRRMRTKMNHLARVHGSVILWVRCTYAAHCRRSLAIRNFSVGHRSLNDHVSSSRQWIIYI